MKSMIKGRPSIQHCKEKLFLPKFNPTTIDSLKDKSFLNWERFFIEQTNSAMCSVCWMFGLYSH